MLSYRNVIKEAKRGIDDNGYLEEMKKKHEDLTKEINKLMMKLKRQGHVMGADFRNKLHTTIQVPRCRINNRWRMV